ncbi:hypothetical protein CA13_64090 [Planctomycetes bacterium CA13]|uniref:Arsenical-resistance protein n=1 Tax=Novipirellula herctigrandis TaxID=2527986 RepID=A0A5C5ZCP4_9BACT|nr:hypothetical protein CA13_64090 [Planctomycetes bacterium CA13]
MTQPQACPADEQGIGFFERYLTVWVGLCIVAGIAMGKVAPGIAKSLDNMAIYVNDAPVISIPIATYHTSGSSRPREKCGFVTSSCIS